MTRLSRRIDKLGGAGTKQRCVLVIQEVDETFDQALARWQAGHPGEDLDAPGTHIINVRLVPGPPARQE